MTSFSFFRIYYWFLSLLFSICPFLSIVPICQSSWWSTVLRQTYFERLCYHSVLSLCYLRQVFLLTNTFLLQSIGKVAHDRTSCDTVRQVTLRSQHIAWISAGVKKGNRVGVGALCSTSCLTILCHKGWATNTSNTNAFTDQLGSAGGTGAAPSESYFCHKPWQI